MKTINKDQWIEEVLMSTESIKTVEPPENLSIKILDSINHSVPEIRITTRTKWLVAASLALLISFNFLAYRHYEKKDIIENQSLDYAAEFQLASFSIDF